MAVLISESPAVLPLERLSTREMVVSLGALLGWLALFAGGLIVGTETYRNSLGDPKAVLGMAEMLRYWSIVFTCYTLTNVALLCCLSSMLGACGRRARLVSQEEDADDGGGGNPYVSSLIRGFFIYLVLLSGVLVLFDKPFSETSQEQYLRLAGFVSLLSFMVGYNPHLFAKLLARIGELVEGRSQPAN